LRYEDVGVDFFLSLYFNFFVFWTTTFFFSLIGSNFVFFIVYTCGYTCCFLILDIEEVIYFDEPSEPSLLVEYL